MVRLSIKGEIEKPGLAPVFSSSENNNGNR